MLGLAFAGALTGSDKFKLFAGLVLVLAILGASFGAGWAVNGWRKEASYAKAMSEKDQTIADLTTDIIKQNAAVDVMHEKKVAADDRRKLAADMSKSVLQGIEAKAAKAASSTATDCKGVLREAWENAR